MPPKSDTPAYFAITGTLSGGRNDVSTKNEFTVIVSTVDAASAKAVQSAPREFRGGFAK